MLLPILVIDHIFVNNKNNLKLVEAAISIPDGLQHLKV